VKYTQILSFEFGIFTDIGWNHTFNLYEENKEDLVKQILEQLTCFVFKSKPRPKSSTPQLFETIIRSFWPVLSNALIKFSGIPHNPKPEKQKIMYSLKKIDWSPPTSNVAPCGISCTASWKSS